jgi:hypothetical protein
MSAAMTVAIAITLWCASGSAQDVVRVAVGELRSEPRDASAFSRALSDALGSQRELELTSVRGADLVVRGSIVRWERRNVGGSLEVRCEVSLIVSDAGGSIRAMLRGRGGARGGTDARLSEDALRAAVRGALRPLAEQGPALARAS